ncbi:hypothetical protein H9P43_003516 [Blastocladiella emersonii ATCC 22665]|nr:hypothetical protein H9P43_003516 [Blastocladiella emersonii ATCC 22665]
MSSTPNRDTVLAATAACAALVGIAAVLPRRTRLRAATVAADTATGLLAARRGLHTEAGGTVSGEPLLSDPAALAPPPPPVATPDLADPAGWLLGAFADQLAASIGLAGNPMVTGTIAMTAVAAVLAGARLVSDAALDVLSKRVLAVAEVDSRDEVYSWILEWLAVHTEYGKDCTHVAVSAKPRVRLAEGARRYGDDPEMDGTVVRKDDESLRPVYYFPAMGRHFFWHKGRLFCLSRDQAGPRTASGSGLVPETLTITTFATSREPLEDLLREVRKAAAVRDNARTAIYTGDQYGSWRRLYDRPSRPMESVVLDARVKGDLVADAQDFLKSEMWYAEAGLPYRRGYLLSGPPGTGKTSLVTALAGHLELPIYIINLASTVLDDSNLLELMLETPPRCIMLLEDIHAVFKPSESDVPLAATSGGASPVKPDSPAEGESDDEGSTTAVATGSSAEPPSGGYTYTHRTLQSKVSFSTLLNILDGVIASEGRLLIMTSNSPSLDPALLRPGRIDRKIYLGNCTPAMAAGLVRRFFATPPTDTDPATWEASVTAVARAMAQAVAADAEHVDQGEAASRHELTDQDAADAAELQLEGGAHALHRESRMSPAQVVGFLMRWRGDAAGALANLGEVHTLSRLMK